jgi:hypothetical protein
MLCIQKFQKETSTEDVIDPDDNAASQNPNPRKRHDAMARVSQS